MNPSAAYSLIACSFLAGGGSLLLFGIFLVCGPFTFVQLQLSEPQALVWDAMLSILFFIQHSGMIRKSFQRHLGSVVPKPCHASVYAIASGMVLAAVVLLWQPSQSMLFRMEGLARLLPRVTLALAILGFWWGVRALRGFDALGIAPIRAHLRSRKLRPSAFTVHGPYLWVRHPLYFFSLLVLWSAPDLTADRLLLNGLWSGWIVLGAYLEERDLVETFGEDYRNYRKEVPMLIPWRMPGSRKQ
jgi:methanethiol S-methyltransferase